MEDIRGFRKNLFLISAELCPLTNSASGNARSDGTYGLSMKVHCPECGCLYEGEYATSKTGRLYYYYRATRIRKVGYRKKGGQLRKGF